MGTAISFRGLTTPWTVRGTAVIAASRRATRMRPLLVAPMASTANLQVAYVVTSKTIGNLTLGMDTATGI